jgi:hypothetical protein
MGLTPRPSKNIDLSKIDDIQSEFFSDDEAANENEITKITKNTKITDSRKKSPEQVSALKSATPGEDGAAKKSNSDSQPKENLRSIKNDSSETKETEGVNLTIADLLATAKSEGVRHTSRPFTVPRSLTIDLNRLKTKFRTRDLQYTQNELMDKMIKESLETVTADNYFTERERAFKLVKSPEQCSRRSVTLNEETASEMADLKASLAMQQNRRVTSDEIFTTLLAIAFANLYENGLL